MYTHAHKQCGSTYHTNTEAEIVQNYKVDSYCTYTVMYMHACVLVKDTHYMYNNYEQCTCTSLRVD